MNAQLINSVRHHKYKVNLKYEFHGEFSFPTNLGDKYRKIQNQIYDFLSLLKLHVIHITKQHEN